MSRILITIAVAAFIWSCDSGAAPEEKPQVSSGVPSSETKKPEAPPAPEPAKLEATKLAEKKEEPKYVTVQHILIGFKGSVPRKNITRTKEEAGTLAADILKRARAGEDFDKLVREYTDDSPPGIYKMSNHGAPPRPGVSPRGRMVPAFGDVGFSLEVGGIGMAVYDPTKSRYGWHIIKRTE